MASGLSDHDALLLTLSNIPLHIPTTQYTTSRLINEYTSLEFQSKLSYESWDSVFNGNDVDIIFNPSAWGHLNPSSYCDVGRLFYGVFKLWSKLQRKK